MALQSYGRGKTIIIIFHDTQNDDMADTTTIEIKTDTWRELNQQKEPGDSFDDVISGLLSES
jgi:hypothetical protein